MSIKQDYIEVENIYNKDGEQTLSLTGDQGIVVSGDVNVGGFTDSGTSTLNLRAGGEHDTKLGLFESSENYGFSLNYDGGDNKLYLKRHDNSSGGSAVLTFQRYDNNAAFAGDVTVGSNKLTAGSLDINGNADISGTLNVGGNTTFGGNAFGGTYLGVNTNGVTQWGASRGILTWGTGYASIYAGSSNELWIGAGGAGDKSIVLDGSTVTINKNTTFAGKVVTTEVESASTILLDAAADITIDAGGQDIILSDDGTIFGTLSNSSGFQVRSRVNNADLLLRGVDDGTEFTALQLDMSDGGWATFNSGIHVPNTFSPSTFGKATFAGDVTLSSTAPIFYLDNTTSSTGKKWRLSSAANGKMYITQDGVIDAITLEHTTGKAIFAGNGQFDTNLKINAPDGGGAPATTAVLDMHGYEGRGVGIKMRDSANSASSPSNREWFVGTGYAQSGFNIGYASDGSQSSYTAQAKLSIGTDGNATFAGDVQIDGGDMTIVKQNGSPTINMLRDSNDPGTGTLLHYLNFQVDYGGSHQDWGGIEHRTTTSATRTKLNFNVKSTSGNVLNALSLDGTTDGTTATFGGALNALGGVNGYYLHAVRGNSTPGGNEPAWAILNNAAVSSADHGWAWYDSNADGSFQLWRRNNSTTANNVLSFSRSTGDATFAGELEAASLDINGNADISGHLSVDTVTNSTVDLDKFLVIDSGNRIYYRTGAQVLSDIGAGTGSSNGDVTLSGAQTFTGAKTFNAHTQFSSTVTVGASTSGHDVVFYGNDTGEMLHWDESTSKLNIRHDTDDSGLTIFTVSSAQNTVPQIQIGRDNAQYWGVYTDDRIAHLVHRQDETSGAMSTYFEQWDSNTSDATGNWVWRYGNGSGGSMAEALTLTQAGDLTLVGDIFHSGDSDTKIGFSAANTFQVQTGGSARLTVNDSSATFAGIVSVPTGKAFRMYNAAGSGWGEMSLEESENKLQFNRGIKPTGNNQSDQTLGTSTKRWHTLYAGVGNFSEDVTATANYTAGNSKIIYKAQRSGGAVAGDWSYDDATTDMSLGTSTAHSFSLKTGNTRALTINSSQNATFAGDITVGDDIFVADGGIINLGTGNDLQLYHDASHSHIVNLTGNLRIRNFADDSNITFESDDGSGGVAEYFRLDGSTAGGDGAGTLFTIWPDNSKIGLGSNADLRMSHNGTSSTINNLVGDLIIKNGADDKGIYLQSDDGSGGVTTYILLHGALKTTYFQENGLFTDDKRLYFGSSADLAIYHDGSNNYIQAAGTGDLLIRNLTDDKDIIFASDNGSGGDATYFRVDGSAVETRFHKATLHYDNIQAKFGDSGDLQIQHNGTDSQITNSTGHLQFTNTANNSDISFASDNGAGGDVIYFSVDGGAAEHDGSATTALYTIWPDKSRIAVGTGKDLQLYHDGSNSYIDDSGTGELRIRGSATAITSANGSQYLAYFAGTGAQEVSLYAGNAVKFKTVAAGVNVTGAMTASGDVVAFSDRKLKENIETLDGKKVLDMRGVSFTRKDTGKESSGVIAQEIQEVAPELVSKTDGTLGVSYGNLVGYLIEAVKDQQKQIDELKAIINGSSK